MLNPSTTNHLSLDEYGTKLLEEGLSPTEVNTILEYVQNMPKFQLPVMNLFPDTVPYRNLEKVRNYKPHRLHHGQRKLMLTEVLYLLQYGHLSNTVVYAGAAPGTHILLLIDLFPNLRFILWDPVKFDTRLERIVSTGRVELHNDYFTDESAELYAGQNVIFISDIRSEVRGFEAFEQGVHQNNNDQKRWIEIMNPVMSSLKFRIPFTHKGPYVYLRGMVYLQPWAPEFSAETRLVTDGKSLCDYDPVAFENTMHYYNNVVREFGHFQHEVNPQLVEGLCYCNDCCYEIYIWKMFLKIDGDASDADALRVADLMKRISAVTGKTLLTAIHGSQPEVPMLQKRYSGQTSPLLRQPLKNHNIRRKK
jgi:hypothetical protein